MIYVNVTVFSTVFGWKLQYHVYEQVTYLGIPTAVFMHNMYSIIIILVDSINTQACLFPTAKLCRPSEEPIFTVREIGKMGKPSHISNVDISKPQCLTTCKILYHLQSSALYV